MSSLEKIREDLKAIKSELGRTGEKLQTSANKGNWHIGSFFRQTNLRRVTGFACWENNRGTILKFEITIKSIPSLVWGRSSLLFLVFIACGHGGLKFTTPPWMERWFIPGLVPSTNSPVPIYWAILKKIAHMSVVWASISLWLCGFVALWLCVFGCVLQELIRLKVLWVDARNQWDFGI